MTTYSAVGDLLTGDMPFSSSLDPAKFVQDATDEVDSYIGMRYATPLDLADTVGSDPNPIARPARLLIKRIANFLASGRLILAQSMGGEDKQVQAYGQSLIVEALAALKQIVTGAVPITGAEPPPGGSTDVNEIAIINADSASAVDVFYKYAMPVDPWGALIDSQLPRIGPRWAPNS